MIINHPTIQGLSKNVPDADVDRWLESGWLLAGSKEALAAAPEVPISRIVGQKAIEGVRGTELVDLPQGSKVPDPEPCPTCGATGDEPCRTAKGNETNRHAKRA